MKFTMAALSLLVSSFAFAGIETYKNPSNVSAACAGTILRAIESHATLKGYVPARGHADLEWWDESENEMYVTVTDKDDAWGGYLTVRYAVRKGRAGSCTVGKLVDWSFAT